MSIMIRVKTVSRLLTTHHRWAIELGPRSPSSTLLPPAFSPRALWLEEQEQCRGLVSPMLLRKRWRKEDQVTEQQRDSQSLDDQMNLEVLNRGVSLIAHGLALYLHHIDL